jgi:phage tail-like protein
MGSGEAIVSDYEFGFNGDTPTTSNFLFEVDGVSIGMFAEVSGLEVRIDVATYREGGENGYVHQLPGRMTWPHVVLKRGVTNSDALFSWVNKTSGAGFSANSNKLSRSTGAITVVGTDGIRLRSWNLTDVFAVRWTGPRFSAETSDPLNEELELAHHGFTSQTF